MNGDLPAGATPIDSDAATGLIPSLTTRGELNEFEERNILAARRWAATSRILRRDYPNVTALLRLHLEMFNLTWRWAGEIRQTDTNIGVHWRFIQGELFKLCGDTHYWIAEASYGWVELGAQFHHRLVSIHPFANGNGRHARLATDILLRQNGQTAFTWGSESLSAPGVVRQRYIEALRSADSGYMGPLMEFVLT